ncbi:hypothetical protein ACFLY6_02580 [Candidatus Dependentiae bacterium]
MKNVALALCLTLALTSFQLQPQKRTKNRASAKKKDASTAVMQAKLAKNAERADIVRLISRANSAIKGFGQKGKKLNPNQRKKQLQRHIKSLSLKSQEILKETSARRELFNLSIRDSILGLLLSIKKDSELAGVIKSRQFKKLANTVEFSAE